MDSQRHFAMKLFGQSPLMQSLSGASTSSPQITLAQARSFQSSSLNASPWQSGPNPLIQLPTLGNTGVKLNGSRWSGPGAAEGMSVFDTAAAMELLRNGPEPDTRRLTSAAIAHANRIQRHAQMNATIHGFKLLPDLTPGRAFVWGSFLALWCVGTAAMTTCRSLDIHSRAEFPVKMKAAFQPVREWAQAKLGPVRERLTFEDQPLALTHLQTFGTTYRRRVSSGVPESELLASQ